MPSTLIRAALLTLSGTASVRLREVADKAPRCDVKLRVGSLLRVVYAVASRLVENGLVLGCPIEGCGQWILGPWDLEHTAAEHPGWTATDELLRPCPNQRQRVVFRRSGARDDDV
jgi:hypothetical protein